MPYGFQDPLSDVDGLQVASAGPGDRLLPAREESPAPEPSRLSLEYPPRGESRSFAGTSDEFLREAPRRAASIRIDDSEAGEAAGFGVSGPRRSVETMGDEREVLTARGRAGGAQAELQNAILGTRANKERLDLAEKVLLERRKILPQGLELARLERLAAGPFASMNAKRARAIRAAAQRGREPSSSDLRFLQTFEAAAGTLQLVRGMDEALAEIPAERAALGRELSRLASLPPPISPDEAEVLTRSAIESRRGEEREKLRKDRQGDQRTRLRQQLGDAERQVNALAEMEGIDPGDLEDPQDAADYFALVRRVEEREGLDLESLRRRLKYVEREIDVDLGLAPPADLGGGDELLGQLRERYPGVSDDELREALR